ncbi:MAG: hypothetical protein RIR26_2450 [Pseudomonadota bacterium]
MRLRLWSACSLPFVVVSLGSGAHPRSGSAQDQECAWVWQQLDVAPALEMIHSERGENPGEGITIGHLDTGIIPIPSLRNSQNTASGLSGLQWNFDQLMPQATFNWVQPHLPPLDNDPKAANFSHGTETASLLVGYQNNDTFNKAQDNFRGLVPWAKLIPIKVTDSVVMVGNMSTGGAADLRNLAEGIRLATALGVDVMTISLGAVFDREHLIEKAVAQAEEKGIIVVAAGGQALPVDVIPLPARLPAVIGVTASTRTQTHWTPAFSGHAIAWAAPGENICHLGVQRLTPSPLTAMAKENTSAARPMRIVGRRGETILLEEVVKQSSGTSYATAYSAGAAALWLQYHGAEELKRRYGQKNISTLFKETATRWATETPAGWNSDRNGSGILNIRKLLTAPLPCTSEDTPEACLVKTNQFLETASR